jgi:DNA modification methylase
MIECKDSLEWLQAQGDLTADIIFADIPYNMGAKVIIKENGKPDYSVKSEFMNKWNCLGGEYWELWFKEAYRVLKHGGRCLLFSIDRQSFLFRYYACLSGLEATQNLYWYFISNFPKSSDLSKMIDRSLGAEREVVGEKERQSKFNNPDNSGQKYGFDNGIINITKSNTELGKKYEGIRYSISPLKQTLEEIMVFNKPTKTGSVLHDVIAYENGDNTIAVNAWNIDNGRVGTEKRFNGKATAKKDTFNCSFNSDYNGEEVNGRYPAQLFVDSAAAEILDEQSGLKKSSPIKNRNNENIDNQNINTKKITTQRSGISIYPDDIGGASKILHHCDFAVNEFNLLNYCPKTSAYERNAGCDEFKEKQCNKFQQRKTNGSGNLLNGTGEPMPAQNSHPCLKPISLIFRISQLLKMPTPQKVLFPFAGSGSEIIGFLKAGFIDVHGCEINPEYIDIANARIKYWRSVNFDLEYRPAEKSNSGDLMESLF